MTSQEIQKIVCRRCYAVLDADDKYCRRCGAPTGAGATYPLRAEVVAEAPVTPSKWWENPWIVLLMLFLVMGPLALPMLWRSRCFSRFGKIALTIVVTSIALFGVWLVWYYMYKALEPLRDFRKLQGL